MIRPETEPGANGAKRSGKLPEAAPIAPADFEDTGPLHAALGAQGSDTPASAMQIAEAIIALGSGDGGGGGGGGAKSINRTLTRNTILAIITILGGVIGTYFATVERSKSNEESIEDHSGTLDAHSKDIRDIGAEVKDVGESVDKMRTEQQTIAAGIEQLKVESVKDREKRLKEENARLRDRLRTERNR